QSLGTAPSGLTISGGTTLDSSAAFTVSNANPLTINGDFAFPGNFALNMGTGAVSLGSAPGTSRTLAVNASTLTLGGIISNGTTAPRTVALNNIINYAGLRTLNNNHTLQFQGEGGETYSGAITGTGNINIRMTNSSGGNVGNVTGPINMVGSLTSIGTTANQT